MTKTNFKSIDEYISACPPQSQERLQKIRETIKKLVPDAKERISYQIACFELNGKNLIHFAGWKKHVSLYSVPAGDEAFESEVSNYVDGKGTVKFPLDEPMPMKIVTKIIKLHVVQNKKKSTDRGR
jgi:uncharacterized protein YdhG (YjbR/CyaY superfamily)